MISMSWLRILFVPIVFFVLNIVFGIFLAISLDTFFPKFFDVLGKPGMIFMFLIVFYEIFIIGGIVIFFFVFKKVKDKRVLSSSFSFSVLIGLFWFFELIWSSMADIIGSFIY